MEGLTTGRVVHYNPDSEPCRAAIVTHVFTPEGCVNLWVFPDGLGVDGHEGHLETSVMPSEGVLPSTGMSLEKGTGDERGKWHWPERA